MKKISLIIFILLLISISFGAVRIAYERDSKKIIGKVKSVSKSGQDIKGEGFAICGIKGDYIKIIYVSTTGVSVNVLPKDFDVRKYSFTPNLTGYVLTEVKISSK